MSVLVSWIWCSSSDVRKFQLFNRDQRQSQNYLWRHYLWHHDVWRYVAYWLVTSLTNQQCFNSASALSSSSPADPGFPIGGGANLHGGRQHMVMPKILKKCMKLREFWAVGRGAPLDPPLQFLPLWSMDDKAEAEPKMVVEKDYYYEADKYSLK